MRNDALCIVAAFVLACNRQSGDTGSDSGDTGSDSGDTGSDSGDTGDPADPVAVAGADLEVKVLDVVSLDGSASFDPGSLPIVQWSWTLLQKPAGSVASLEDTSTPTTRFTADVGGTYLVSLSVANALGTWDDTPDTVQITAEVGPDLYIELFWQSDADIDLHLLDGSAQIFSQGDCSYCNRTPEWGPVGPEGNPEFLTEDIPDPGDLGGGAEIVELHRASGGTYTILAHYYGLYGQAGCGAVPCPDASLYLQFFLDGTPHVFTGTLEEAGDVWTAVTISFPAESVTLVDSRSTTPSTGCTN